MSRSNTRPPLPRARAHILVSRNWSVGATAEPVSSAEVPGDRGGHPRGDRELIPASEGGVARRPLDGLDDAGLVERLQRHRFPAQLGRGEGLLDPVQPLVAEPEDELAPGPSARRPVRANASRSACKRSPTSASAPSDGLLRSGACRPPPRKSEAARGSVNASSAWSRTTTSGRSGRSHASQARPGPAPARFAAPPDSKSRAQRAQQAQVGIAAEVSHLVVDLQPGHQAGVEHRRLAHAGGAVVEDHRPGAGVDDEVVELADGLAPAEEDRSLGAGEPLEPAGRATRAANPRAAWAGRTAGCRPPRARLQRRSSSAPGGQPQLPGEAAVVGGVGPALEGWRGRRDEVAGAAIGLRAEPRDGQDPAPGGLVRRAQGRAGGELGCRRRRRTRRRPCPRWPAPWR